MAQGYRPGDAAPPAAAAFDSPEHSRWLTAALKYPRLILVLIVVLGSLPGLFAVPTLDRDEGRFAQASKQMLESGDLIEIRYQEEYRNKKPVGIYWLQAASTALFSSAEAHEIWSYRLPSLAGAIGAVLLTFAIGLRLFGPAAAFLGAALLGASILLTIEAIIAKTDAMLLFTVVATQFGLVRAWLWSGSGTPPGWGNAAIFWVGLGCAILIKGPIGPMVTGLTIVTLGLIEGRWRWLLGLKPLSGAILCALIVLPWALAILSRDVGFIEGSAGEDLLPKLVSGTESHGQPPGAHFVAHILALWPGSLLALPAVIAAWRRRREAPGLLFLLAWLIPSWIVFELVPTKLPHYPLPVYPAIVLMIGWSLVMGVAWLRGRLAKAISIVTLIGGVAFAAAVVVLPDFLGAGFLWPSVPLAAVILAMVIATTVAVWQNRPLRAVLIGIPGSVVTMALLLGLYLPAIKPLFASDLIVAAAGGRAIVASDTYHEPSLVFRAGTELHLTNSEQAAADLAKAPASVVVSTDETYPAFAAAAAAEGLTLKEIARERVFNYNRGWQTIRLFTAAE